MKIKTHKTNNKELFKLFKYTKKQELETLKRLSSSNGFHSFNNIDMFLDLSHNLKSQARHFKHNGALFNLEDDLNLLVSNF